MHPIRSGERYSVNDTSSPVRSSTEIGEPRVSDGVHIAGKPIPVLEGEHAGIRVPDFDAAVPWFSDKLDFRLTRSSVVGPTSFAFMSPAADDSFSIELLANPSGAERPSDSDLGGSHNLMGWHHICSY